MDIVSGDVEVITVMNHSSEVRDVASKHESSINCRNNLPIAEPVPVQGPILLNIDSNPNSAQMPFIPPHVMSSGAQPALVFFVGPPGVSATSELPAVTNAGSSAAPFANALFFAQPITLNVVPQDTPSSSGVIEKAMELANFQTSHVQGENQQPSQTTTEMIMSESNFIPANVTCGLQPDASQGTLSGDQSPSTLSHVSQNIVIAHSVATGENVPIDNVSQSVTVQTSQVIQNQGFAELQSFIEESHAEIAGTEIASAAETDAFEGPPVKICKRKGIRIREVVTQTGGDPEVTILTERKLEYGEDSSEEPVDNSDTQRTVKKPGLFI